MIALVLMAAVAAVALGVFVVVALVVDGRDHARYLVEYRAALAAVEANPWIAGQR